MPANFSATLNAEIASGSAAEPIALLDIQVLDGTTYYWATQAIAFTPAIGGPGPAQYLPWVIAVGPFRYSRSNATDAGDVVVQNLSGNTLGRDVMRAMVNGEFEGALVVVRFVRPLTGEIEETFVGRVTEPEPTETQVTMRVTQLDDFAIVDAPRESYSDLCTWRYQSRQCGSTSNLPNCTKDFAACQARGAAERFNGVLNPPPISITNGPSAVPVITRFGDDRWQHQRSLDASRN